MKLSVKDDVLAICKAIAAEQPGWQWSEGLFKNTELGHTIRMVRPGLTFSPGTCHLQPSVRVRNQKVRKLYRQITGGPYGDFTSLILFRRIFKERPNSYQIWRKREGFQYGSRWIGPEDWPECWLIVDEAEPFLRGIFADGRALLDRFYDFSSEENFLRNLPTGPEVWITGGLEQGAGIMVCLAHIILGDFEFVEWFASDAHKTEYPKQQNELDQIIAALPELRRRYAETGKVI
jgi:hypothetical protein